jgi:putative peptidoglycan lipid II flippase
MSDKILNNSFYVLLLIVLGKILSFLRDIIISWYFGASYTSDAFFAANNVPSILLTAILSSFIVLLIPTYKKIQIQEGKLSADIFVTRIINIFLVASLFLSLLGFIFIKPLIIFVAPGFDAKTFALALVLGKILVLSFPFSSISIILATVSNANNKYFAPHVIPLFSSFFVIVGIISFAPRCGILAVAVSGVLAFVFQLAIQIGICRKHFVYYPKALFFDKNIKNICVLTLPVFIGFSIDQINLLVNSIICSNLSEGSLSSLTYAQRLQTSLSGTVSVAVITVVYPLMSKLSSEKNTESLHLIILKSLKGITLVLLPVATYLAFHTTSVTRLVFFRGNFNEQALIRTSDVFAFYSLNILALSLREFILRIFYIANNTRYPLLAGIISIFINILLSMLLVNFMGVSGLSLANLIATSISLLVLFISIEIRSRVKINLWAAVGFLKIIALATVVMLIGQMVTARFFNLGNNIYMFALSFMASMLLYFSMLLFFGQEDSMRVFHAIRCKITKYV